MSQRKWAGTGDADPIQNLRPSRSDNTPQIASQAPRRRDGRRSRDKGNRAEREIIVRHPELGIHVERYPLSGASRFRGSGHDVDVYAFGRETAPLVAECKARRSGGGFVQLERWLGDFDVLMLRRNNAFPMVVVPWRVWLRLLRAGAPMRGALQ